MMLRRFAFIASVLALVVSSGLPQQARATSISSGLSKTLSDLRFLTDSQFGQVVTWARGGNPGFTGIFVDGAIGDIKNLGKDDHRAVVQWLRGYGRYALYDRGATDADIGRPRPGVDGPSASPTPGQWRNLSLASASLDGNVQGQIQILGGFAAAKRDGKSAVACVSFQNVAPKAATRVVIEFPLLADSGNELGKLTLDRSGTFSPNVGIMSYGNLNDWQNSGLSNRGFADNCVRRDLGVAALPILESRYASYRVVRVEYADGTSWTLPAPP